MFIRAKVRRDGQLYYELVESYRCDGKVRQKVLRYLGKTRPTPEAELRVIREVLSDKSYYLAHLLRSIPSRLRLPRAIADFKGDR